ncbi:MAG TPA: GNAT family N-acetyltransferase, partial [Desulfobacterales bacterium]|nr:GNAT family N-acetyltransferase [Desulfobacterales bacterium]
MKIIFREAVKEDIPCLVQMLADDALGENREDTSLSVNQNYMAAFHAIEQDLNNELTVAIDSGAVVGMLQLTFIPYLTHIGSWRCLIEGVRIHAEQRCNGLGMCFIEC